MKEKDIMRLEQLEAALRPLRHLLGVHPPVGGWVRAIREALGMTNVQLARRLNRKAPQTIEDMQEYEVAGTVKLRTLQELAEALNCKLVYALVPTKPLEEIRRERAYLVARRALKRASHSMKLEDQGVTKAEEDKQLERLVQKLLAGSPKKLWD